MTTLDMTSLELATLDMSPGASGPINALPMDARAGTMMLPPLDRGARLPIDEPSSMTLVLIGMVTLAAYRGIQKRITGRIATKTASPKLIKPRRAA